MAGVQRGQRADRGDEITLLLLEHESSLAGADALQDGAILRGDDREHLDGDAVELVEAAPCARLREAREKVARHLVVHLIRAVGHDDPNREAAAQILGRLGLAGTGGALRRATHHEAESLGERDVAAIGECRDDQPGGVTNVLVARGELRVADVDVQVLGRGIVRFGPAELEL